MVAILFHLIEVGALAGLNKGEVGAQNAVFIKADNILKFAEHPLFNLSLIRCLFLGERFEPRFKKIHKIRCNALVGNESGGKGFKIIRQCGKAQIAAIGSEHGHLAPVQPQKQRQLVKAVVFCLPVPHSEEEIHQFGLHIAEAGAHFRLRLQKNVMHPIVRCPVAHCVHRKGVLVNGAEPHVLQNRQAIRERNWVFLVIEFEVEKRVQLFMLAELQLERAGIRQGFQNGNVCHRIFGVVAFLIRPIKGVVVFLKQGLASSKVMHLDQTGLEPVFPGFDNGFNPGFHFSLIEFWRGASVPPNDNVHPCQRPFRERGVEGRNAAMEIVSQIIADFLTHFRVIAFARHIDQNRHKSVKPVAARQRPHPWPLIQLHNGAHKF